MEQGFADWVVSIAMLTCGEEEEIVGGWLEKDSALNS
jgi:hypothetical protein